MPTIVNTFEGTQKIKRGQRIRIDAKNGTVLMKDGKMAGKGLLWV